MDWFLSTIWEDPLPTTTKKEITEMADIDPDPWDMLGRKKRSIDLRNEFFTAAQTWDKLRKASMNVNIIWTENTVFLWVNVT